VSARERFRPSGITFGDAVTLAAAGTQSRMFVVHKFGKNESLASGDTVMEPGSAFPYLTHNGTAKTVRIKAGGDAADDSGGTGAQKVIVDGLDADFNLVSEEITTNGADASTATTATFIRVVRARVSEAGSGRVNAAAIVIEWGDGSGDVATLIAGEGQSQLGFFTIPAGYKGYLSHVLLDTSVGSATATVEVNGFQRTNANDVTTPFSAKRLFFQQPALSRDNGSVERNFEEPFVFNEYTDIWFEGIPSTGTPSVAVAFTLILELK
jgi:hypothetical protein